MVVKRPARHCGPDVLGPRDAGRMLSRREYLRCRDADGYLTEIIDGAVHVSPSAQPLHDYWCRLVRLTLESFADERSDVINYIGTDNDIEIPGRRGLTRPRPDQSAYRGFPPLAEMKPDADWADFSPVLVVEVISRRRARKDTHRNRNLYWLEPNIAEYWIVDPRKDQQQPRMIIHVREPGEPDWIEYEVPFGDTWESSQLPGLKINLREAQERFVIRK